MTINLHFHVDKLSLTVDGGSFDQCSIDQLKKLILETKEEIIMAITVAEQALIDRFNAATNLIAQELTDLKNNPPAEPADFEAALQPIIEKLEGLGAPGTPVPPAPTV